MKKILVFLAAAAAVAAAASCQKEIPSGAAPEASEAEIIFAADAHNAATKAVTEITPTASSKFYVSATSDGSTFLGDLNKKEFAWPSGSNKVSTGNYWPTSGTVKFYALTASKAMTLSTTAATCSVSTDDGDLLGAYLASEKVTSGTAVKLDFYHTFARLHDFRFYIQPESAAKGMSVTVNEITFTPVKSNTLSIKAQTSDDVYSRQSFTGTPVNGTAVNYVKDVEVASSVTTKDGAVSYASASSNDVDFLTASNTFKFNIKYTVKMPGFEKTYTKDSAELAFKCGVKSDVVIKFKEPSDDLSQIEFTVEAHEWGEEDIETEL